MMLAKIRIEWETTLNKVNRNAIHRILAIRFESIETCVRTFAVPCQAAMRKAPAIRDHWSLHKWHILDERVVVLFKCSIAINNVHVIDVLSVGLAAEQQNSIGQMRTSVLQQKSFHWKHQNSSLDSICDAMYLVRLPADRIDNCREFVVRADFAELVVLHWRRCVLVESIVSLHPYSDSVRGPQHLHSPVHCWLFDSVTTYERKRRYWPKYQW